MNIDSFVDKVSSKYDYDYRTINALKKIIPALIEYYGNDYVDIIISAISDCEIIHCDSFNTISSVIYENNLLDNYINFNDEVKRDDGIYISKPVISYDNFFNKYEIDNVIRKIIVSHTYNFDSPKGLEVLTYQLCSLIKSYYKEYEIEDNILHKRCGLSNSKSLISKSDKISFADKREFGNSLENGMNIYDTEKIVSLILKDNYKCYHYDSISTIAMILKGKFGLKDIVNRAEIINDISPLKKISSDEDYSLLNALADRCYDIEEEMLVYSMTRDKKDELSKQLSLLLSGEVYNCLIKFGYYNYKKRT